MTKKLAYHGEELNLPLKLKKLKYIVVGTGRCGTVYLAKFLSSLGIPCTHEAIFRYDGLENALDRIVGNQPLEMSLISKLASIYDESEGINWFQGNGQKQIMAESSYMAAPYLNHPILNETSVIHVIREPMKVINSLVEGFGYFKKDSLTTPQLKEYHEFIYSFIPALYDEHMHPVTKAALYYVEWNEMIEKLSKDKRYFLHRIEKPPTKLLSFLKINNNQTHYNNNESNHKDTNEVYRSFKDIPDIVIRDRLQAMYDRYYRIKM